MNYLNTVFFHGATCGVVCSGAQILKKINILRMPRMLILIVCHLETMAHKVRCESVKSFQGRLIAENNRCISIRYCCANIWS